LKKIILSLFKLFFKSIFISKKRGYIEKNLKKIKQIKKKKNWI